MSETYNQDYYVPIVWTDLTTVYSTMASVASYVQNKSNHNILVAYTANTSAPTGGGQLIRFSFSATGNAAHIWAKSLGGSTALVALGVV